MKKRAALLLALVMALLLAACSGKTKEAPAAFDSAQAVADYLLEGNRAYVSSGKNTGDLSADKRRDASENGQHPYAVIITCSDSRAPAEHIFNAGIGELFVIRTAGNVIGDYELGSVEYGAEHLHARLVVVLGHTQCGAVDAALSGGAYGHIKNITDEIAAYLPQGCGPREAEIANVEHSIARIMESEMMEELVAAGHVEVRGAIYDISTGQVRFLD